jgi:hypothetical protein
MGSGVLYCTINGMDRWMDVAPVCEAKKKPVDPDIVPGLASGKVSSVKVVSTPIIMYWPRV